MAYFYANFFKLLIVSLVIIYLIYQKSSHETFGLRIDCLRRIKKKKNKIESFCVCFSGVHLLRFRRPQSRLRHDLLRGSQCRLFLAIRLVNEIRRQTAADGVGRHCSCLSHSRSPYVEASSRKSLRLFLGLRTVGCR